MFRIEYHKQVFKDLDKIPDDYVEKIVEEIRALACNPFPSGYKKLSGKFNAYRIRIGDYRIIYIVDLHGNKIRIMRARHRKDIYQNLNF